MKINNVKASQRAVAPIIATLLMVAISVVGGILIFVFAQDFFTSSSVHPPSIDSLQLFGYDASDSATLLAQTGNPMTASAAADQKLADSDGFVIYIRNQGASPVIIETVKVFGTEFTFDTTAAGTALGTGVPADLKWVLTKGNSTTAAAQKTTGAQVIQPGEEMSLVVGYDNTINGDIKIGRTIPVVIKTGNAAVFTKQVENGIRVG